MTDTYVQPTIIDAITLLESAGFRTGESWEDTLEAAIDILTSLLEKAKETTPPLAAKNDFEEKIITSVNTIGDTWVQVTISFPEGVDVWEEQQIEDALNSTGGRR